MITKPTRISETSSTLIDHIYSNNIKKAHSSGIVITDVSDHLGTYYMTTDTLAKQNTERKKGRCLSIAIYKY